MRRLMFCIVTVLLVTILLTGCAVKTGNASVSDEDTKIVFDKEHLLPIGSVVLLKDGNKKIMICGRAQSMAGDENNEIFDYSACYYPEGIINPRELFLFNNEQIEEVVFTGYENDDELTYRELLETKMKEKRGE